MDWTQRNSVSCEAGVEGLERDERNEVAAAGRAILMLVDEIERLHVLMWDRHLYPEQMTGRPLSERLQGRVRGDPGEAPDFDAAEKSLMRRVRAQFTRQDPQRVVHS